MESDRRIIRPSKRALRGLWICWGLFLGWVQLGNAQDPAVALEGTLTRLIEQAEPSVVSIARIRWQPGEPRVPSIKPFERGPFLATDPMPVDPEDPDFQPNTFGAGVIISGVRPQDRMVLTNYHVVQGGLIFGVAETEEASRLFIRFSDRRSCFAKIIAADPRSDLAVLSLELAESKIDPADLKPLDTFGSTPLRKGQLVVLLGNPYAIAHDGSASASWGMISNLARRPLPWTDDENFQSMMYRLGNLVQIDGRLNLGGSGGPLLNLKGELVGLTTSLAAIEGYEKSAGFAIPMDELTHRIVKSLVAGHEVEYGVLGILKPETMTPAAFRKLNTGVDQASAALVKSIQTDSPADRAGIRPLDIILKVGDVPIYSHTDLMRVVGLHPPESKVEITGWRADRGKFTTEAILGKWPVRDDIGIIETTPRYAPWRGISVDYSTGRQRYQAVGDPYRRAVLVTKVAPGSAGRAAEIQPGTYISQVNRIPVQTPGEFAEATKSLRGPVELRLNEGGKIIIGE